MVAVKSVEATFAVWGLQGFVEGSILSSMQSIFSATHATAVAQADEWYHLSMEDIRKLEEELIASRADDAKTPDAAAGAAGGGGGAALAVDL
jgi:hypothetical protein